MTLRSVLFLSLLLIACEPVKKPTAEADVAKPPPEAQTLAPPDHAVTFEVEVDIDSKKPNGKGWDVGGGKPDPMVTFTASGRDFKETKHEEDTNSATFTFGPMKLGGGDTLSVKVEDKDLRNHDAVGAGSFTFVSETKSYEFDIESAQVTVHVDGEEVAEEPPEVAEEPPKIVLDAPPLVELQVEPPIVAKPNRVRDQKDSWVTTADEAAREDLATNEWVKDTYVSPGHMNVGVILGEKDWSAPMISTFVCAALRKNGSKLLAVRFVDIVAMVNNQSTVRDAEIHKRLCE